MCLQTGNYGLHQVEALEIIAKLASPWRKIAPVLVGWSSWKLNVPLPARGSHCSSLKAGAQRASSTVLQRFPSWPISVPFINKMGLATPGFYLNRECLGSANNDEQRDYFFQFVFIGACGLSCIFRPQTPRRPTSAQSCGNTNKLMGHHKGRKASFPPQRLAYLRG